jgi:uncharacterized protein (TIGR02001 family)
MRAANRHYGGCLLQLIVLTALPWPSCRADGPWSASIEATTDYVLRGISQTYDRGAVQMGASYQDPRGWFAGVWGSNVDPYPAVASAVELDLYAGISRPLVGDFNGNVTYTRYQYVHDPRPARYDYDELQVSASYLDRLILSLSYQPDLTQYSELGFAQHKSSLDYELAARWPLPIGLAVGGGVGYYDLQRLFGVSYWAANLGVRYAYRRASLELTRFFAAANASRLYDGASANGTWVLTASFRY